MADSAVFAPMIIRVLALLLAAVLPVMADCAGDASNLAKLIVPAKLATLGKRGANSRVQKAAVIPVRLPRL